MPCFVVNVWKSDQLLAKRLITQIRSYYNLNAARLIVIADGYHDQEFAEFCLRNQSIYICGKRLKTSDNGGLWTQRYMIAFLKLTKDSILIKVDPDSFVWRAFLQIYPIEDMFGTINNQWTYPFVRGGCIGFWRGAVLKIIASKLLESNLFKGNPEYQYQRYKTAKWSHEEPDNVWLGLSDRMVGFIAAKLGLSMSNWDEVDIQYRDYIPRNPILDDYEYKYAVTHPHVFL